ncbi:MAG: hypothetical protein AAGA77_05035 [Bacteroidota bacterium]
MRYVINGALIAIIILLAYMLVNSIKEPIAFGEAKEYRKSKVVKKLETIRKAQEIYRYINGQFASSFEDLATSLTNDSISFEKIIGDPDDPTNADKFERIVTYSPAIDSIRALGIQLDSLKYIPFGGGKTFDIAADTIEYQKTMVSVVEVGTKWKTFMGKYADPRYGKYDSRYDPNKTIKFGDMFKPNISGNWER